MIRTLLYKPDSGEIRVGAEELLECWHAGSNQLIWVDFDAEEKDHERELLKQFFDLNDLALDDCQRDRHPPKLEFFDRYYFLLLKGFTAETDSIDFEVVHISQFVGRNFIVTRHGIKSPSINKIWSAVEQGSLDLKRGSVHISYKIIRTIIDRYTPIILEMEKRLDQMEEVMLEKPSDELLGELISYNTKLKKLRRIYGYQESVIKELSRSESELLDERNVHEFNDAHEQMERLASLCSLMQELTSDLIEGYISVSSHRLNRIMKVLTITTVIFLPLTLLAGIYGMNFQYMPELSSQNGYYIVLGIMIGISGSLLLLFRLIKWL